MSSLIPHVTITQAVGATLQQTDNVFDDLVNVGGWPVSQNIKHIQLIEVFATDTAIRGIRITYNAGPTPVIVLHGQAVGLPNRVTFDNESIILVGVFGGRDANGRIASIGFVRFDTRPTANPPVNILGPFGSTSPPTSTFGTYGEIIALIGTDNNETGLRSLGFVKADAVGPVLF